MDFSRSEIIPGLGFRLQLELFIVYPNGLDFTQEDRAFTYPIVHFLYRNLSSDIEFDPPFPVMRTWDFRISETKWQIDIGEHQLTRGEQLKIPPQHSSLAIRLFSPHFKYLDSKLWTAQIPDVIESITRFQREHQCLIDCNSATGLRVAVTNSDPLRLPVVKALLQMATTFERSLDEIHVQSRIRSDNEQFVPVSALFNEKGRQGLVAGAPHSWVQFIQDIKSREEFDLQFGPGTSVTGTLALNSRWLAYTFFNAFSWRVRCFPPHCIEFRQHVGTLDVDDIMQWANLCCHLMIRADIWKPGDMNILEAALDRHASGNSPDAVEALEMLGMFPATLNYYRDKLNKWNPGAPNAQEGWMPSRWQRIWHPLPLDSPLRPLLLEFSKARFNDEKVPEVQRVINAKLAAGEYGWVVPPP